MSPSQKFCPHVRTRWCCGNDLGYPTTLTKRTRTEFGASGVRWHCVPGRLAVAYLRTLTGTSESGHCITIQVGRASIHVQVQVQILAGASASPSVQAPSFHLCYCGSWAVLLWSDLSCQTRFSYSRRQHSTHDTSTRHDFCIHTRPSQPGGRDFPNCGRRGHHVHFPSHGVVLRCPDLLSGQPRLF